VGVGVHEMSNGGSSDDGTSAANLAKRSVLAGSAEVATGRVSCTSALPGMQMASQTSQEDLAVMVISAASIAAGGVMVRTRRTSFL